MNEHAVADEALDAWLQDIAGWLKLPALRMNPDGACAILFDGKVHVTFQLNPQSPEELWLLSELGTPPAQTGLYAAFLRGNMLWRGTGGATLGLSADDPARLVIAARVHWRGMARREVVCALENFIGACEHWAGQLASHDPTAPGLQPPHTPPLLAALA